MPLANVHYDMFTAKQGVTRAGNVTWSGAWANNSLGVKTNSVQLRTYVSGDTNSAVLYPPAGRATSYGPFIERTFQGDGYGYIAGGAQTSGTTPHEQIWGMGVGPTSDTIQKFPLSSDLGITDVGNLTQGRHGTSSTASKTHGYTAGGYLYPTTASSNIIEKYPFSSDTDSTDVGDLAVTRSYTGGTFSPTDGYAMGGQNSTGVPSPTIRYTNIDKYPFSSDTNATGIGNLTEGKMSPAGHASTTHGYSSGGELNPGESTRIDKFPFSTDTPISYIADMTIGKTSAAGISSPTNGYSLSGFTGSGSSTDVVDKFPFTSDANSTDIMELAVAGDNGTGISSTERGYHMPAPNNGTGANLYYFNYSSDTTHSPRTQGLTVAVSRTSGTQV
jgi:hypothetical protein